jgi:AcrR family transcriptional regulator
MTTATATTTGLRERSKRRRLQQILEATRSLLRERPDESPGLERIAARAEVAPATIFNLIGPREQIWAALADDLLAELERRTTDLPRSDPHTRARAIATTTVDIICADANVYRYVLANWSSSGRLLRRDPTSQLVACLRAAADDGTLRRDLNLKALGETISTACTGAAHQWAAGLISDRALRRRCQTAVDLAFAAATPRISDDGPDYLSELRSDRSAAPPRSRAVPHSRN